MHPLLVTRMMGQGSCKTYTPLRLIKLLERTIITMRSTIVSYALLLSAASVLASPLSFKRSAEEDIVCPSVCEGEGCVPCAQPESPLPPTSEIAKRNAEEDIVCPRVCEGEGCVPCGQPEPCPDDCDEYGCVECDDESKKRSVLEESIVHPCAEICNEERDCGCDDDSVV